MLKVIKHPAIEDYRQSVLELDEMEYVNLRYSVMDLRNCYALLYDLITKNLVKLTKPRRTDSYTGMYH